MTKTGSPSNDQGVIAPPDAFGTKSPWKKLSEFADNLGLTVQWPTLADAQQPRPKNTPTAAQPCSSNPRPAQVVAGQGGGNANHVHNNPFGRHSNPGSRINNQPVPHPPYPIQAGPVPHPYPIQAGPVPHPYSIQAGPYYPPLYPPMVHQPHAAGPDYPYPPYPIHGALVSVFGNERNMPQIPGPNNFRSPPYLGQAHGFMVGPGFPGSVYYPTEVIRGPYPPRFTPYPVNQGPPTLSPEILMLRERIIKQIEYYFSDVNLQNDNYLIKLMNEQGWVPTKTVAGFRRVKAMTTDIGFVTYALRFSKSVQVQGDKIRKRHNWSKWVLASKKPDSVEKIGDSDKDYSERKMEHKSPRKSGLSLSKWIEDENDEIDVDDQDIQKLVIVTQNTGKSDGTRISGTKAKNITKELASTINYGLHYFEQELKKIRADLRKNIGESQVKSGGECNKRKHTNHMRFFPSRRSHGTNLSSPGNISESPPSSSSIGFFFGTIPTVASLPKSSPFFEHPIHQILDEYGFKQVKYLKFHKRSLDARKKLGIGCSEEMNSLYRFWSYFMRYISVPPSMYEDFKKLSLEDAADNHNYGLECLFKFYRYGLKKKFDEKLYKDFEELALEFYHKGNLYGLEKYWAFHHKRVQKEPIKKQPELEKLLVEKYRSKEDFRAKTTEKFIRKS